MGHGHVTTTTHGSSGQARLAGSVIARRESRQPYPSGHVPTCRYIMPSALGSAIDSVGQ